MIIGNKGMSGNRPYSRGPDAEVGRKLHRDRRWCGPHVIRKQALLRGLYICQRCGCLLIEGVFADAADLAALIGYLGKVYLPEAI